MAVTVGVNEAVAVIVGVSVIVGVTLGVGVLEGVGVWLAVAVTVCVRVAIDVAVGLDVAEGDAVGVNEASKPTRRIGALHALSNASPETAISNNTTARIAGFFIYGRLVPELTTAVYTYLRAL